MIKKLIPILLLICLLSISFAAANDNANNIGNFTDLQNDIEKSYSSGVLNLEKNYKYDVGETSLKDGVIINQTITINGNGHSIDGSNIARIFNITANNTVLNNIVFINGNSTGNGGALYIANPVALKCNPDTYKDPVTYTITIKDCLFENNTATETQTKQNGYGGAIYSYIMKMNIINSKFIKNNSTGVFVDGNHISGGGAICAQSNDRNTEYGTYKKDGYVKWGDIINITNTNFNLNEAKLGAGGAFYSFRGKYIEFNNVSFENNTAKRVGAIMLQGSLWFESQCNIYEGNFINNNATTMIGAIYYSYFGYIIKNTNFINNNAIDQAGALYGYESHNITIDNCTFKNYLTQESWAGAVMLYAARNCQIINSKFNENKASYGGAIYFINDKYTSLFEYSNLDTYFTIENSTFENNIALEGGAICIEQGTTPKTEGLITVNATLNNLFFKNNKATNSTNDGAGGAIYSYFLNNLTIKNNIFLYNVEDLGNEIYNDLTNTSITTSIFVSKENNSAIWNNHKLIIDYSIFDCKKIAIENKGNLIANYNYWNDNNPNFTNLINGSYTINNYIIMNIIGKNSSYPYVKLNYTAMFILNDTSTLNKDLPDFIVKVNSSKGIVNPSIITISKNKGNFTLISSTSTTISIINLNDKTLTSKFINITVPDDSLSALNLLINGNSTNKIIKLDINYKYYKVIDDLFIDGIPIINQVTIDGNHHYISAEYTTSFFNVTKTGSLTLINTNLIKAREIAIINNGELSLENVTTTGKIVNNGKIKSDIVLTIISRDVITTYDSFVVTLKTQNGVNIEMNNLTFKDDKNHTFKSYIYNNGLYLCYVPEGVIGQCTFNNISITGYDKITAKGSLNIKPYTPKKLNKASIMEKLYNKNPTINKIQNKISDITKPITKNINILFSNLKLLFNKRLA